MTLSERDAALKAFRKAQRKATIEDKERYASQQPPAPDPEPPTLTARDRALLRAEQQGA